MATERQLSEISRAFIERRIEKIEVFEAASDEERLYIDFHGKYRIHWYVEYLPRERVFGRFVRINRRDDGVDDVPAEIRQFLITLIPPEIIARCTAAALRCE